MRVVAGPSGPQTLPETEPHPHVEALARLAEQAEKSDKAPCICTLILRSPVSAAAQALLEMTDTLAKAGVQAKAILAKLDPEHDLDTLCAALQTLAPAAQCGSLIRWARNPRLWDAHEQARYGLGLSWWGDPLRRSPDKRNPLALFETAPEAAARADAAFRILWAASVPLPKRLQSAGAGAEHASGSKQKTEGAHAPLEPSNHPWPLLRH